jgi:hypothetical protein
MTTENSSARSSLFQIIVHVFPIEQVPLAPSH